LQRPVSPESFDEDQEVQMISTRSRDAVQGSTTPSLLFAAAAALLFVALAATSAAASGSRTGFGFGKSDVAGFPTGRVVVTGGGAFEPLTPSIKASGGFSCITPVAQGQLLGCSAGEGVRWDTEELLTGTTFKCTGSVNETLKPISSDDATAVFQADFYRAGDANDESFTAQMIVSDHDIADDIQGVQSVWVQGVGCGTAVAAFGS
jgi:hypothetical protein